MKNQISSAALQEKTALIVRGITDGSNAQAFTGRSSRHYMEDWDWYQGVALHGLYVYCRATGDRAVFDYLTNWFDRHIAQGLPDKNVNSMCPLRTLSYLYEDTGREAYGTVLREWAEYAMAALPRTMEGGFQHKTIDSENYMQLWDDTLYMLVLFLTRYGLMTRDERYIQESVRQFLVHIKYLTNIKTGLLRHGFNFDGANDYGSIPWGRGNAWFTAGLVDYLELAPLPEGVRQVLTASLLRQAEALLVHQDAEGMWHTLIDEEDSCQESSATAGFAYGLLKASRLGLIDGKRFAPAGLRGCEAIFRRIGEDGILASVSAGTCLCGDRAYYRGIPIIAQPYGQSMALLLLLEAQNWL